MEQKTENFHAQEVPQEPKCNVSSTSTGGPNAPKQRCIRRQSPDEQHLEKLLKNLEKNRPKVSLTPAEIEEDMKFFSQILKGTNSSSDTRQEKVLSVSEAAFKPEPNDVPGVSAKPPKPQHRRSSH